MKPPFETIDNDNIIEYVTWLEKYIESKLNGKYITTVDLSEFYIDMKIIDIIQHFYFRYKYPNIHFWFNIFENKIYLEDTSISDIGNSITLKIPYSNRNLFAETIVNINNLISDNASVFLCAFNNPYNGSTLYLILNSILDNEIEAIKDVVKTTPIVIDNSISLIQGVEALQTRGANMISLVPSLSIEDMLKSFDSICLFPDESKMNERR